MIKRLLSSTILFAAACSSSATNPRGPETCGPGTVDQNGECVPTTGSGSGTTCGTGTMLDPSTNECVPVGPGATAAPTITAMTPDHAGLTGNVLFQIKGTGFAGPDITAVHVYFGDTTPGMQGMPNPCEAAVGAVNATTIAGSVPFFCFNPTTLALDVTVTTDKGMATTPFHYDALYAADGSTGAAGNLWIVDPYASLSFNLGAVADINTGAPYAITGLTFASDGTLYGVTAPDATLGTHAQLVTLGVMPDPFLGTINATVVGRLFDAQNHVYSASSIKMVNGTLYGWVTRAGGASVPHFQLATIDTATGLVTPVGSPTTFGRAGALAVDSTNTLYVAPDGAGADANVTPNTTGELATIDTGTGALTAMALPLDSIGAPVTAMTFIGAQMVAAVDFNAYAAMSGTTMSGAALAIIDPTASNANGTVVSYAFELPAVLNGPSHVDAIEMAPATLALQRHLPAAGSWQHLGAAPQR